MTYTLGVDLGTTFTAAAVDDGSGAVPLRLGSSGDAMPSVVAFRDGEPVTGDAAEEVLESTPSAGVREAKRRLGDSTPMIVDGTPYGAEAILGLLLADVLKAATEQQGGAPSSVVLSHPANWGDYKQDLLSDTARVAGLDDVGLITEPQAAAVHYVRSGELEVGQTAGVYDFGGGTFDAAIVRCAETGPELLGEATGLERLGGIDLDQAILMHVNESVDGALRELDGSDPAAAAAMAAVRAQCVAAKEALSAAGEAVVKVALPGLDTEVRLTRTEFEAMLRPRISDTLRQLDAALTSAKLSASDLGAVLLVGGTSRIPLVGEMVADHTGVPVAASADHKTVVCAGAASGDAPVGAEAAALAAAADGGEGGGGGAFVVTGPAATDDPEKYRGGVSKRRLALIGGAGVLAAGAVVAGAVAAGAVSPGDVLGASMGALGLGEEDGAGEGDGSGDGGGLFGEGGMLADAMDVFDDVAPEPAAAGAAAPAAAGGGGYATMGATPMARAATVSSRGSSASGSPSHSSPRAPSDSEPDGSDPTAPAVDPEFLATKSRLLESVREWEPPEGVEPAEAEAFREELLDRMERFQPMPGESTEHALQAMRDAYEDQVGEFADDQRFEELEERLDEVLEEQAEREAAAAAVEAELEGAKERLLERLRDYEPSEAIDPEAYAEMREDVEALIDRYQPVPGQTPEEALEELRFQYSNRVKDLAQDTKLEGVAEELSDLAEDEEPPEARRGYEWEDGRWVRTPGYRDSERVEARVGVRDHRDDEDESGRGHWERGREGEPGRVWVDEDGTRHYDREVGPLRVRDHRDGDTEITYGRAYRDRAQDPPAPPTVTENDDGTVTVTFTNEQGRHVTIRTNEPPADAIAKYHQNNPPPQQSGNNLSTDTATGVLVAPPVTFENTGIMPPWLLEQMQLESLDKLHHEALREQYEPAPDEQAAEDQAAEDQAADEPAEDEPAEDEPGPAEGEDAADDEDVVGDELEEETDLDEFDEAEGEGAEETTAEETGPEGAEPDLEAEPTYQVAPDYSEDGPSPEEEFAEDDASAAFATGGDDSADEFDTAGPDPTGDDINNDPVMG